ncbi:MAG TPA: nucleotide sugar dehydrogenase [Candidatus Aquilonibacter sp.]|jgi:GDP-mannose 6-dehydrogenase|nr:nucleotide sugar dehydrogenase [Candidatus Aquilonibacter sp.]
MKVSVFGLGYVGSVSGACLAQLGHQVIGVDANPSKVTMINEGLPPVIETGLTELLEEVTKSGKFSATEDWQDAIAHSELALVCVGTPSNPNGSLCTDLVKRVSEQIGTALATKDEYFVVAIRSTVLPGTVERIVIPSLESRSGKTAGRDFGVCMVPEFLREGTSVKDFFHPPRTVIGELDSRAGQTVASLFEGIEAPLIRTSIPVAESLKYADNAFHALKVTFANEIGSICKAADCDSHEVMNIFCMDNKLNLSPYYLKPGFAFGGSCLPKDLRALTYHARSLDVPTPLLDAILVSNKKQIERVTTLLQRFKGRSLGFLGLSFKHGTDDLRESPILEVIETMLGRGFRVAIYDEFVSIARLVGANKEYIQKEIPHVSSLMRSSAEELVRESDVVVVSTASGRFREVLAESHRPDQVVVDLIRIVEKPRALNGNYYGICW